MSKDEKSRRLDDDQLGRAELLLKMHESEDRFTELVEHSKAELLHDLQVHQIELEMQNQQLKESQHELEVARDRYADLYDYAPVSYLTLDEKGLVLEINLTGAALLGRERQNIVGLPMVSLLVASSIHHFLAHLRQVFATTGNSSVELWLKPKDGISHFINLESLVVTVGDKRVCRTVMTDISEQRRLAVAAQINRSALETLLGTIPALVFYLDSDQRFLNVSLAFADFLGLAPEDIHGKTLYDIFPHDVAEELGDVCASVLHTGMALYGFENSLPDASGTPVSLSTMLAPCRDPKGRTIGLVGVSIDITTIKSAAISNSELLIQNRRLTRNIYAAIEDERRHLARELHDELGQWLTAIQAEAEAILIYANNHAPKIHDSAVAISSSAKAVHKVIRGMLRHLRPGLLDELGLADSLRELQRQWSRSHPGIHCELELETSLAGLGEELNVTIFRLVQEALSNISSYAHARRVTVNIRQETGEEGADFLILKVDDDGAGFDAKKNHAGMGMLGMRERVIAAGGNFYLDAAPGKGTHILAKLPLGGVTEGDH